MVGSVRGLGGYARYPEKFGRAASALLPSRTLRDGGGCVRGAAPTGGVPLYTSLPAPTKDVAAQKRAGETAIRGRRWTRRLYLINICVN